MKSIFLFLCFFPAALFVTVQAQENQRTPTAEQKKAIFSVATIYYYGVDFSHVRINDAPKVIKNNAYSPVYPPAWIAYVEKEMPPMDYVKKALKKKNLVYKQDEIREVSINVSPEFIIAQPWSFPADTVQNAIRKYALSQQEGTGLVLIAECFSKPLEQATTWVVFFDLKSRDILWAVKTNGDCKHMGYTAHWASGVIDGFKDFIRTKYK
jgi:hypothetical protein